jgi:uncharacterized DUF497 family protein
MKKRMIENTGEPELDFADTERENVIRMISLRKALGHERTRFEAALGNELGES